MRLFLLLTLIFTNIICHAQKDKTWKFGKASIEQFNIASDNNDAAIVLFRTGDSYFDPSSGNIIRRMHSRIKIINEDGLDYGNIELDFDPEDESISSFKAKVYNYENGELVISDSKPEKFIEEVSEDDAVAKFTLPNVKVGSLIEYQYVFASKGFYGWTFQEEIPVKYSEFSLRLPNHIKFRFNLLGYYPIKPEDYIKDAQSEYTQHTWKIKNLEPYIYEEYSKPSINYLSALDFELLSITRGGIAKTYSMSWEEIVKNLMNHQNFGDKLRESSFQEEINVLYKEEATDYNKMLAIFNYSKSNFEWNEYISKYSFQSLRKTFKDKKGNAGELNILLINLLKSANLKAYPVLLSTRSRGEADRFYPTLSNFNYVIAAVIIDEKRYLLDLTSEHNSINVLPYRCLNGNGRIIYNENKSEWIPLVPKKTSKTIQSYNLELNKNLSFKGSLSNKYTGNAALYNRLDNKDFTTNDDYAKVLEEEYEGLKILKLETENSDDTDQPFKTLLEIEINDKVENLEGLITVNPIMFTSWEENPFNLDKRLYPIDFNYPKEYTYIVNLKVPEFYNIDELPTPIKISSPDKSCSFLYDIKNNNGTINVMARIKIKKANFGVEEYDNLKLFFTEVANKLSSPVILMEK